MSETDVKIEEDDNKDDFDREMDALAEPPNANVPEDNPLWPDIKAALKEIYDPEIPVNVYELGLIYEVKLYEDKENGVTDAEVKMTLTSPGCPVAQEMPGWVQGAILPVDGVGEVDVEIIWEPTWSPAMMSEAAKMQLNMFM